MPPQRTMPLQRTVPPVKPVKSERTHEENQERAYIAASRRSDRSLEARVESARRASEIHKRRTGRALRVTESDVLNEEMYEEEDDDFPHTYRSLNMLMMGGPFDRRMAAYYQHQMQMRNIVDRALQERIAQTGSMASSYPVFANPYMPAPQMQQQQQQQQQQHQQQQQQQQSMYMPARNPSQMQQQPLHRQQPYPPPNMVQSHGRSMSMHIPTSTSATSPSAGPTKSMGPDSPARIITSEANQHVDFQRAFRTERHASLPTALSPGSIQHQTPLVRTPQSATSQQPASNPLSTTGFTDQQQLMSPSSDEGTSENYLGGLFPFTSALPPESSRFFMGQLHGNDPNYEISGDLLKLSSVLSPSSDTSKPRDEVKTNELDTLKVLNSASSTVPEFDWQQSADKFASASFALPLETPGVVQAAGEDFYDPLFKNTQTCDAIINQSPSDGPGSSWNDASFSADFFDQDIWGSIIDQDFLESNVT